MQTSVIEILKKLKYKTFQKKTIDGNERKDIIYFAD